MRNGGGSDEKSPLQAATPNGPLTGERTGEATGVAARGRRSARDPVARGGA